MKTKCDNECSTCTMQNQIFCILSFAKASNDNTKSMHERIVKLESGLESICSATDIVHPIENGQMHMSQVQNFGENNQTQQ